MEKLDGIRQPQEVVLAIFNAWGGKHFALFGVLLSKLSKYEIASQVLCYLVEKPGAEALINK